VESAANYESLKSQHLRALVAGERGERFAVEAAGLHLDYSKNRITDETVRLRALRRPFAMQLRARASLALEAAQSIGRRRVSVRLP
jgi:glucose-6-phosphate isomerase